MANVVFENVQKIYDSNHVAVDGINFSVEDGELLVLVGPSGCGKSTTLRMLAGLESVTSGSILIDNQIVNQIPPKDRDIAMVFQNYALYPHMTVYNNLAFGLKLRKYPISEIKQRVGQAAEILGITDILDRKPKQLSGGQQQRVAVGRAIVRKPKVFLFDEPLSNLDAKLRVQMRTEISRLHRELNATMIYVTHDQTEAMTLGNQIVVMNRGVVQQIDNPVELYHHPQNQFVAEFIGNPGMNFITGMIEEIDSKQMFVSKNRELCLRISKNIYSQDHSNGVVLGFRPEAIKPLRKNSSKRGVGIFEAEITFEEHLGSESYVYGKTLSMTFMSRVSGTTNFDISECRMFEIDGKRIHIFDIDTGHSLLHR
ncbi:MAG: sn-glycerol-3-phosphate ABC transporter ATP-binding protein UgpC [Bacteroidetes bacterium]|nr:sn-glycerol-3-phosphate ABC transporter ATP-binding protein UgpC [Bacteroidota bacterium]